MKEKTLYSVEFLNVWIGQIIKSIKIVSSLIRISQYSQAVVLCISIVNEFEKQNLYDLHCIILIKQLG
jgi:hypothetical protein